MTPIAPLVASLWHGLWEGAGREKTSDGNRWAGFLPWTILLIGLGTTLGLWSLSLSSLPPNVSGVLLAQPRTAAGAFVALMFSNTPLWILLGGSFTTLALFGLGWALTTAQRRAGLLAREMTRELRAAEAAARRASRAKSEFLANMSHELRTPLNSVIGFANLLLKNKSGNLQTDDLTRLERIKANGFHLLTLVNDVLDLSRVEAGRMPLLLSDVNLDILVLETISEMESRISEKKEIRLLTDLPSRLAAFRTDERKFKQVLINLMNNALKFTEQGSITIGVVADAATARPTRLEVRDTGIGIPEEKREVIFEAFQQADNTTARQFGGSGLGLTITAALLKLMGHRLELDSEVGRGSTFRIVFGTPEDETPASEARTVSPSSADNSAKDRTAQ